MKTIVIVDDSKAITNAIATIIKEKFENTFKVVAIDNVADAIEFVNNNEVSLLIQDVHVNSYSDGLTCASIAKALGIPVCIITTDISKSNIKCVAENKYDRIIFKPFICEEIETTIKTLTK